MTQQIVSPLTAAPAASLENLTKGRWTIALCGIAIQMMLGTVYAWSIFKGPIQKAHGWAEFSVGITFALTIFFLGFAAAIGGRLVDKAGSRAVATVGGILFGTGTCLGALGHQIGSIELLWIGYGVIAGIGNGLGYVTPVAVLARWFPEKKGMITGLAVMGFGLGAAFMSLIGQGIIDGYNTWYGAGAGNSAGIYTIFYVSGVLFLAGIVLCARKLVNPPPGYAEALASGKPKAAVGYSFAPAQARGMGQLYILWGILFLNVVAGIALLSNMSPMAQKNLGITAPVAMTIVMAGSFFNGFGRIFWGALSEKLGRRNVFILIFLTQIPLFILLPQIDSYWLFAVVACYIMLCYGGGFGTMPSFTADTFGSKNMGAIYGMVLFAWGVAGGVGPGLMEWIKKSTGTFNIALYIAAGFLAAGFILTCLYRKPAPPAEQPAQEK